MVAAIPCFIFRNGGDLATVTAVPCFIFRNGGDLATVTAVPCFIFRNGGVLAMVTAVPCFIFRNGGVLAMVTAVPCFIFRNGGVLAMVPALLYYACAILRTSPRQDFLRPNRCPTKSTVPPPQLYAPHIWTRQQSCPSNSAPTELHRQQHSNRAAPPTAL
ncbi:hypothetical protein F4861DRAFT_544617 [Xylaria intraflava]|nr:hypothetical protein F4861DRAFT_544617 [Xylaria intraflava]